MSPSKESSAAAAVGRREFLKLAVAASVAGALPAAANVFAQPSAHSASAPDTTASTAPKGPSEDAIALAGILRRRFPGRLSEEQWKAVTEDLDSRIGSGKRLRESKLANGIDPDFSFRA